MLLMTLRLLNLKTDYRIDSPRIAKAEQIS